MMKATEIKNDMKSKANSASKGMGQDSMGDKISHALDSAPDMIASVTEAGKNFFNSMSASAPLESLDKTLKARPWTFVVGAAVCGFAAGYFFGHGRKDTSLDLKGGVDKLKNTIEKNINKVSEHLQ